MNLNCPAAPVGRCAVVPLGTIIASVALPTSKLTDGLAVLTPTLLLEVSTLKTLVLTVTSLVTANEANVDRPVTPSVPPIEVLPVVFATTNLSVSIVKPPFKVVAPVTVNVPPTEALPEIVRAVCV